MTEKEFNALRSVVIEGRPYTLPFRPMPDHDVEIHAFRILAMLDSAYLGDVERVLQRVREIVAATQILVIETVVEAVEDAAADARDQE